MVKDSNSSLLSPYNSCQTYSVVERTPLGVNDHMPAVLSDRRISQLRNIFHLLDICTVRPCAEYGAYGHDDVSGQIQISS